MRCFLFSVSEQPSFFHIRGKWYYFKYVFEYVFSTFAGYLELLSQLTTVGDCSEEIFCKRFDQVSALKDAYHIVVVEGTFPYLYSSGYP